MIAATASFAGFILFSIRSGALQSRMRRMRRAAAPEAAAWPRVSIIVPARNEEKNLRTLLSSLQKLDYPDFEVIVVDDHSADRTGAIAQEMGCTVVTPPPLPGGWVGKCWACFHGFNAGTSEYFLFTDADTFHQPLSLKIAMTRLLAQNVGLVSAIPYHRCVRFWEKLQGGFQTLLFVATNAFGGDHMAGKPSKARSRIFCIGQYLLFRREAYRAVGTHEAVKNEIAEDVAFARLMSEKAIGYALIRFHRIVDVRMYPEGLGSFIQGWRRNFHSGMRKSGFRALLETSIVITWFLGTPIWLVQSFLHRGLPIALDMGGRIFVVPFTAPALFVGSLFIILRLQAFAQRGRGDFPIWGIFFYPFSVMLFVGVSLLAVKDLICGTPVSWKGRSYDSVG